jgi:hypothetical protein
MDGRSVALISSVSYWDAAAAALVVVDVDVEVEVEVDVEVLVDVEDDFSSSLPQPATTNPRATAAAVTRTIPRVRTGSITARSILATPLWRARCSLNDKVAGPLCFTDSLRTCHLPAMTG